MRARDVRERVSGATYGWRSEAPMLAVVAAMFAAAALSWSEAPARMPVHWNFAGQVDRYGGRVEGLFGVPLLALALYLLFLLLPLFQRRVDHSQVRRVLTVFRALAVLAPAAGLGIILAGVWGLDFDSARVVEVLFGIVFVVIGNYLGKLRPNRLAGVRTPWTLSSPQSWNRTNRLGGRAFMVLGVVLILAGILDVSISPARGLAALFTVAAALVVYSYVVWRDDPERTFPFRGSGGKR